MKKKNELMDDEIIEDEEELEEDSEDEEELEEDSEDEEE